MVAACQAIWFGNLLKELKIDFVKPVNLLIDNDQAIILAKNRVLHGISKHIETKFHFLRNQVQNGIIEVVHCRS